MNRPVLLLAATVLAPAATFFGAYAEAADSSRIEFSTAPGACVAAAPSDPVRHRVGGLRNAGTEPLYVLCSLGGAWSKTSAEANWQVMVVVANTGAAAATVQCTLQPGYSANSTTTQGGSFTKTALVAAGDEHYFQWMAAEELLPDEGFGSPNVICKLNQKIEVRGIQRNFVEEIGS